MIENKLINTGKRVIELEKDYKEHESILKNEIERIEEEKKSLEEEKESLVMRVKKLEEDTRVMVEKQVDEMNKVIAESKASVVKAILQAKIEMAQEDPSSWDVDTWQTVLDTMDMDEEVREEKRDEDDDEVTSKGKM